MALESLKSIITRVLQIIVFGVLCLYRNMVIGVSWLMGLEVLGLWWRILFQSTMDTRFRGIFSLQTLHSVRMLLYIACSTFSFLAPPECLFSMISFRGVLHCKLV